MRFSPSRGGPGLKGPRPDCSDKRHCADKSRSRGRSVATPPPAGLAEIAPPQADAAHPAVPSRPQELRRRFFQPRGVSRPDAIVRPRRASAEVWRPTWKTAGVFFAPGVALELLVIDVVPLRVGDA